MTTPSPSDAIGAEFNVRLEGNSRQKNQRGELRALSHRIA